MARKARLGRPRLFRKRAGLTVFLEARQLAAIERQARVAGVSVSAFARAVLLRALGLDADRPREES
jgi:hypothetical protein